MLWCFLDSSQPSNSVFLDLLMICDITLECDSTRILEEKVIWKGRVPNCSTAASGLTIERRYTHSFYVSAFTEGDWRGATVDKFGLTFERTLRSLHLYYSYCSAGSILWSNGVPGVLIGSSTPGIGQTPHCLHSLVRFVHRSSFEFEWERVCKSRGYTYLHVDIQFNFYSSTK